ncbi:MAG: hypothetical protein ABEJ93_00115 [Candidatus Nanohalobium sp.]
MTQIKETNWNTSRTGAAAAITLSIGLTAVITNYIDLQLPLLIASAGGLLLAASIKAASIEKFKTLSKPASGVLTLLSGTAILAASSLFAVESFQKIMETVENVSSIEQLLKALWERIFSLSGYSLVLTASFITVMGAALIYWDRVEGEKKVGTRKQDIYFNAVLAAVAAFTAFGSAIINKVPLQEIISLVQTGLSYQGQVSGIAAGILLISTYLAGKRAWINLPMKETVPRKYMEHYRKLGKIETGFKWIILPLPAIATSAAPFTSVKYLRPFTAFSSPSIRILLLSATAVSLTSVLLVKALKLVASDSRTVTRFIPYTLFAAAAYFGGIFLAPVAQGMVGRLPSFIQTGLTPLTDAVGMPALIIAGMAAATAVTVSFKSLVKTLKATGFIPKGLEGVLLASLGVFLSSVGTHLYKPDPTLLLLGVAAALTVWEIGKRSAVLGREIGRKGSSFRSELVQVASRITAGLITVVLVRTALFIFEKGILKLPGHSFTAAFTVLAALGSLLLAFSLKEYV